MRKMLKFRPGTPETLISQLVLKYQYKVVSRLPMEGITLLKVLPYKETVRAGPIDMGTAITAARKFELEKRCDRIVDWFPDPYSQYKDVRHRLHNLRQSLNTAAEQQCVLDFMDENFPEEG